MKFSTLAGIVGSDGHLSKNESAVVVVNKDMEFLKKEVIPLMKSFTKNRITISKCSSGYGDYKYLLRVWDKNLQKKISEGYGIPRGKKLGANVPKLSKNKMLGFLLGWIAGDGSITVDRERPKIEIWSKDEKLLKKFRKFLAEINIGSSIFSASNKRFILRIGKIDDVLKFSRFYLPHPAKRRKLKSLLAPADAGFSTS